MGVWVGFSGSTGSSRKLRDKSKEQFVKVVPVTASIPKTFSISGPALS